MATWREMGEANARAAAMLVRDEHACRAAVSRAYYAIYHEVTHQLVLAGIKHFGRFRNPMHEQLAKLARHNLRQLSDFQREELGRLIRSLRLRREEADYRPAFTVDRTSVHEALRDMSAARHILGVAGYTRD